MCIKTVAGITRAITVLKGARQVLEDENRWTKGVFARDENNESCDIDAQKACKYCTAGAVALTSGLNPSHSNVFSSLAYSYLRGAVGASVVDANDHKSTKHIHML